MKIPKYVIDMMERSCYCFDKGAEPGYTIHVQKHSEYAKINTLEKEVNRLVAWANRQVPNDLDIKTAFVNHMPKKTHYTKQYATVTIYDPVMKYIEKYMPNQSP